VIRYGFIVLVCLVACTREMDGADEIYAEENAERVLCGLGVDGEAISLDEIEHAMVRARERNEVLILFAHHPGVTISYERVDSILGIADRVALPYVTFPEIETQRGRAGLSLGFDDAFVDAWFGLRDMLRARSARVTFYVSNFGELDASQRTELHMLEGDGHAIEAHGMGHRDAAEYVDTYGLSKYLADEIDPMLDASTRPHSRIPTAIARRRSIGRCSSASHCCGVSATSIGA